MKHFALKIRDKTKMSLLSAFISNILLLSLHQCNRQEKVIDDTSKIISTQKWHDYLCGKSKDLEQPKQLGKRGIKWEDCHYLVLDLVKKVQNLRQCCTGINTEKKINETEYRFQKQTYTYTVRWFLANWQKKLNRDMKESGSRKEGLQRKLRNFGRW